LVRSKIRNNSAITPKKGLNLYRLNSAKNTTTIRPVTVDDRHDNLEHHLSIPTQSGLPVRFRSRSAPSAKKSLAKQNIGERTRA
jgi:hypothetical protein